MITSRLASTALALGLLATACTGGTISSGVDPSAPTARDCDPGPDCEVLAVSSGTTYRLECRPVPEALIDVDLPRETGRPIRAIAGVSSTQGIAVMWREPAGCGQWVLALANGLSGQAAGSIREEMERGVERFGVTASPVPSEPTAG